MQELFLIRECKLAQSYIPIHVFYISKRKKEKELFNKEYINKIERIFIYFYYIIIFITLKLINFFILIKIRIF